MPTLRWPRRGRFTDPDRGVEVTGPDGTVDVDDPDVVEQYLARGFERVDQDDDTDQDRSDGDDAPSETPDDDDEPQGEDVEDAFDVDAFLDRTPVSDVADDIASGMVDPHLDAIQDAADRVTVEDAVADRREEIDGA